MNSFIIKKSYIADIKAKFDSLNLERIIIALAIALSVCATIYAFFQGTITSYGDAESHLNIAKRVVDSLTPGFAQLGGIWLPLPHILLIPFVKLDFLWRTGLAGSIVSGVAYVVTALYVYKLIKLITNSRAASLMGALVFMINPNILYLQSTPMTETVLLVFFVLSSYYFVKFLLTESPMHLVAAAFFGFCASLSRYDGWGLVLMEAAVLALYYFPYTIVWERLKRLRIFPLRRLFVPKHAHGSSERELTKLEGRLIMFATLAFFGIALWLLWGFLILGDPLYFTHSQFSAKSQQQDWLVRGELPAYQNIWTSFIYYFFTSLGNAGIVVFLMAIAGLIAFLGQEKSRHRALVLLVLAVPFIFNVVTLYLGQSVIFLPGVTPITFEWTLFNVRYGVMMIPFIAFCVGYLFYRLAWAGRFTIAMLVILQIGLFGVGYSEVISKQDGVYGLSSATAKMPDAQFWLAREYDGGLLLTDDFARTISIIRTRIPMENVIYIGNKPYWEESLNEPEKYATWIVMQKDDAVWSNILGRPEIEARLYKYFNKVYTSDEILIFKRISDTR